MTRTIQDTVFAETLTAGQVGASPASVVTGLISTRLAAFLSGGTPAWAQVASGLSGTVTKQPSAVTLWTSGADTDVYRTVGDRRIVGGVGDTSGYVAFDARTATQIRAACGHDWSTPDQSFATGSNMVSWNFTASTAMNVFGSINEYEMLFILNQSAVWNFIWFGVPFRKQVGARHRGVARTTAPVTGGAGNQQIPVDRDLLNSLVVNEDIWLMNQTPNGNSLAATTIDVVPVVSVGAGFVECNPTNSFLTNALIGKDPAPIGLARNSGMQTEFGTNEVGGYAAVSYLAGLMTNVNESGNDPSPMGSFRGYRIELHNSGAPGAYRGIPSLTTHWTVNPTPQDFPGNGDVNRDNFNDTKLFAPFPALTALAGFDLNLGPFETVAP